MADDSIRIELAFEGGQIIAAMVSVDTADAVERAVTASAGGTVEIDTDDGRITVVVPRVVCFKRYAGRPAGFLSAVWRRRRATFDRELRGRSLRLRPVHGPVLRAARPGARRPRRRRARPACSMSAAGRARSRPSWCSGWGPPRCRRSTRPRASSPRLGDATQAWTSTRPRPSACRSATTRSTPPWRSSSCTSWRTPVAGLREMGA